MHAANAAQRGRRIRLATARLLPLGLRGEAALRGDAVHGATDVPASQ